MGRGWAVVWGLGLAVVGALLASWLGDHNTAWLGGVVGALSGGFAPSVVDAVRHRGEARRGLLSVVEVAAGTVSGVEQPSRLLDPRRQVVDFVGRRRELADLLAWCEDHTAGRVRLVTGPGGVGKSRLAVQLCELLGDQGWWCVPVGDGEEACAVAQVRESVRGSVLLVVDYAETRVGLRRLLRDVATDGGGRLRVLLLARTAGEWWERLATTDAGVRKLISHAHYGELTPAVEKELSDADLVRAAVPSLARELEVPPPGVRVVETTGRARILDLHAAALVAVLTAQQQAPGAVVRVDLADVLAELLAHESRFWVGSADRSGLLAVSMG